MLCKLKNEILRSVKLRSLKDTGDMREALKYRLQSEYEMVLPDNIKELDISENPFIASSILSIISSQSSALESLSLECN